jgi:hypothetical protein
LPEEYGELVLSEDEGEDSVPRIRTRTKQRQYFNRKFDAGYVGISTPFFLKEFVILLSVY